jgi:hypothetical protein
LGAIGFLVPFLGSREAARGFVSLYALVRLKVPHEHVVVVAYAVAGDRVDRCELVAELLNRHALVREGMSVDLHGDPPKPTLTICELHQGNEEQPCVRRNASKLSTVEELRFDCTNACHRHTSSVRGYPRWLIAALETIPSALSVPPLGRLVRPAPPGKGKRDTLDKALPPRGRVSLGYLTLSARTTAAPRTSARRGGTAFPTCLYRAVFVPWNG